MGGERKQEQGETGSGFWAVRKRKILEDRGYFCRGMLGAGAFSQVYRVEKDGTGYACKIGGSIAVLEQEAEIMKKLKHPLFPEFYEFWTSGEWGFLVMELITGSSVDRMIRRRGRFCGRQVIRAGLELAGGLRYLHEREEKYLFRDVKPANVMIRQDGRIKLLDLGCVCSGKEPVISRAGTRGYAAPEQLDGKGELTEGCDIYGLGSTLEAMLGKGAETEYCHKRRRYNLLEKWYGRNRKKPGRFPGGKGRKCRRRNGGRRPDFYRDYRDKRLERKLEQFLERCVRQDAAERISNMRDAADVLAALAGGKGDVWRQDVLCRKNIWESMYKRS